MKIRSVLMAVAAVAVTIGGAARADDLVSWRSARQTAFAAFKAGHINAAADAVAFKNQAIRLEQAQGPDLTANLDFPTIIWPGAARPVELWDSADAPPLVVIPPGEYTAGPSPTASGLFGTEGARRRVKIGQVLAVSKYPITVGEYANFIAESGHVSADQCWSFEDEDGHIRQARSWRNPGFSQADTHPVLCVSIADVQAYISWLSKKTGFTYRLLSADEYEYANRAGATTDFWWGQDAGSNHADCDGCDSLWDNRRTAPVGSFAANAFGLFDTAGNTWVWTSDCYVDPKTPAAVAVGASCSENIIRGGAWHGGPGGVRVFSRYHHTPDTHSATLGFRLARVL